MKVYAGMDPGIQLTEVGAYARRVEAMGYDALQVFETVHDSFAMALLALEHTERLVVRTSVALAFVRSPLLTAYTAWDLSRFSGGRFELGLGTQIRQNIEDRYGMPYGEAVPRMRDYLDMVAAAFGCFRSGERPDHEGPYYRFTRLQPYFNPGPDTETRVPPIWLGGVNPAICRLAGARAAGFVTHPTNSSPRYLAELCRPNLDAGAAGVGRDPDELELVTGTPVVTGRTPAALAEARERQRAMLAFLFSTPAYRRTLELYGWTDLAGRLQALIRDDRWGELGRLITDEVLDTLVPAATYDELADVLLERFADLAGGIALPAPADPADDAAVTEVIHALRQGGTAPSDRGSSRWPTRSPGQASRSSTA